MASGGQPALQLITFRSHVTFGNNRTVTISQCLYWAGVKSTTSPAIL